MLEIGPVGSRMRIVSTLHDAGRGIKIISSLYNAGHVAGRVAGRVARGINDHMLTLLLEFDDDALFR